ncbi:MAG: hypothetical protein OXN90_00970, partial [Gemmatimonadota bacterium]|nr:hypothetical protein [Gemmatimonadota bacterium]
SAAAKWRRASSYCCANRAHSLQQTDAPMPITRPIDILVLGGGMDITYTWERGQIAFWHGSVEQVPNTG